MKIENISFANIDWSESPATETAGVSGTAISKEMTLGDIRLRVVEFSPGYCANHWCSKGHVLMVVDGSLITTFENGQTHLTGSGNTFVISDNIDIFTVFTQSVEPRFS